MAPRSPIIAADPARSMHTPDLGRDYLCGATAVTLDGWTCAVASRELSWLHAALTAALGRGHGAHDQRGTQVQDFSIAPTREGCGWAAVWWSHRDAERVAGQRFAVRMGRTPVTMRLGPLVRVRVPPAYACGPHSVSLRAHSPVVIASTTGRSRGALARGEAQRKVYRERPTDEAMRHALCGLARKLGVRTEGVVVHVVDERTRAVEVRRKGRRIDAIGWVGDVDLVCSPMARWLIECASRGLGLGSRVAFGCGRVTVETR